jgi:hypothetical protein
MAKKKKPEHVNDMPKMVDEPQAPKPQNNDLEKHPKFAKFIKQQEDK